MPGVTEGVVKILGAIPGLLYPVGTTVGYMDGIPWVAFFGKLTYVRVYSGKVSTGAQVINSTKERKERIG